MKYLFLLYADTPMPEPGTAEGGTLPEDRTEARQAMAETGVLIECADLDDALKWAARIPTARDGKVEVRPTLQMAGD